KFYTNAGGTLAMSLGDGGSISSGGSINLSGLLSTLSFTDSTGPGIEWGSAGQYQSYIKTATGSSQLLIASAQDMIFYTYVGGYQERMRIADGGAITIGGTLGITGNTSLGTQTWTGNITWNTAINIGIAGESSFDITSGGQFGVWTENDSALSLEITYSGQTKIGQAGTRGLYVYGNTDISGKFTSARGATNDYVFEGTSSSKYIKFGCLNSSYCHFDTDATSGIYFYQHIQTAG
ncbi:unnamed protein product, partial [marine sediment metagenome]